jgi:hypothetical protein
VHVPRAVIEKPKGGLLSGRKALEAENAELRAALAALGATEREQLLADIERLALEREALSQDLARRRSEAEQALRTLENRLVHTEETVMLQEVGIYEYRHPLDDAVAYRRAIDELKDRVKTMAKSKQAVVGAASWTVNNSAAEGKRMVTDLSKLMLRAYNNEADTLVRSMKPYKLASAVDRLNRAAETISRLGRTMHIEITLEYHQLRIRELELTADYLAKTAEEKEREKEERARLREEEKAQRELAREREKLEKEQQHYLSALSSLRETGDAAAIAELESKLSEIDDAIEGVEERVANVRAGYVYVISNVGAFGDRMVKIGMTRRLVPEDRVRELGDASVPFRYDTHALIFSNDAVGLEAKLHQHFADRRVNLVNARREFFYATPVEVRDALSRFEGNLLTFDELPEAVEWHQSENERRRAVGIQT